jgi:hypothetical protein
LFVRREQAGVQLVCAQRRVQGIDLLASSRLLGDVGFLQNSRSNHGGEHRDDRHHDEHFDQGEAGLSKAAALGNRSGHGEFLT